MANNFETQCQEDTLEEVYQEELLLEVSSVTPWDIFYAISL